MTTVRRPALLAVLVLAALAVGACSTAGAPSGAGPTPSPSPAASSPGDSGGTVPGQPGATPDPNAPVSTHLPLIPGSGSPFDPSGRRVVVPKPGQLGVHPVPGQTLTAAVDGHHVVVTIDYTSGVEPCNILDSIDVKPGAGSFAITLREGHGPDPVACIEIAEFRRAVVDLGELDPGTYRITDGTGVAAPISVTVG